MGTHWGAVYLLDHQGNTVTLDSNQDLQRHVVSVNAISIDQKGEYIATCSDHGTVEIKGLYSDENNPKLNQGQNVKSIALDPLYYKPGSGRKFIVGDKNLTLYEKTFLKGLKATVLSTAEGYVTNITWADQWIAWSSHIGVRVYDLNEKSSLGLIKWEEPKSAPLTSFRCNLRWLHTSSPATLLIGWCDTIRICSIRKPMFQNLRRVICLALLWIQYQHSKQISMFVDWHRLRNQINWLFWVIQKNEIVKQTRRSDQYLVSYSINLRIILKFVQIVYL